MMASRSLGRAQNRFSWHLVSSSILLLLQLSTCAGNSGLYPSDVTIRAAVIDDPSDSYSGFQAELLEHLVRFAKEDNVSLHYRKSPVDKRYNLNLDLLKPSGKCEPRDLVSTVEAERNCSDSDIDIIVGDYWTSPGRYKNVDFTPPWLQTSVAILRVAATNNSTNYEVTLLAEAVSLGTPVCMAIQEDEDELSAHKVVVKLHPDLMLVRCAAGAGRDELVSCIDMLKAENCTLWAADEMVIRRHAINDPSLEMTPERIQHQMVAWPVRKSLDPVLAFLLNKWMYAAVSYQITQELYVKYFEEKVCRIGKSGANCDRPCNPDHGRSDSWGRCVCDNIRWAGPDCNRYRPEDLNLIRPKLKVFVYVLLAINLSLILGCSIWLYLHQHTAQVQVSHPLFLVLVLLGCTISSLSIVALAQEDEGHGPVYACMAIPWMYSVGFSITFAALFSKIFHVYSLFTRDISLTRVSGESSIPATSKFSNLVAFKMVFIVVALNVFILTLWTLVDPLHWVRIRTRSDKLKNPLESQGYCSSESWLVFGGLIGALHFALLAVASYICYCARNIPSKYSQHRVIIIALLSNFQMFIVGTPILVVIAGDTELMLLVRSTVVWMNNLVVICLIFGNLIYHTRMKEQDSGSSTSTSKLAILDAVREYSASHQSKNSSSNKSTNNQSLDKFNIFHLPLGAKSRLRQNCVHQGSQSQKTPLSSNRRPPVSVLSMGSVVELGGTRKIPTRTVSWAENVTLSEFAIESDDGTSHPSGSDNGSERFTTNDATQGAPLQPFRRQRLYASDSGTSDDYSSTGSSSVSILISDNSGETLLFHPPHKMLDANQTAPSKPDRLPSQYCVDDSDSQNEGCDNGRSQEKDDLLSLALPASKMPGQIITMPTAEEEKEEIEEEAAASGAAMGKVSDFDLESQSQEGAGALLKQLARGEMLMPLVEVHSRENDSNDGMSAEEQGDSVGRSGRNSFGRSSTGSRESAAPTLPLRHLSDSDISIGSFSDASCECGCKLPSAWSKESTSNQACKHKVGNT